MTGLLVRQGGEFAVSGFPALAKRLGVWWEGDLPTGATLNLPFAQNKNLIDTVSGNNLITFTRASGGSYVGADGLIKYAGVNEARFDHDPVTGESLGLLVEEARTNLVTYSEDFTNSIWDAPSTGKSRATIVTRTGVDDPSGGTTAATFKNGGSLSEDLIYRRVTGTANVPYTMSVWIRRRSGTGQIYLVVGDNIPVEITNQVTNQWKRISLTATPTTTSVRAYILIKGLNDEIDIWGHQLEAGAPPTSYIPTAGSAVTRAADVVTIESGNMGWFNPLQGTFLVNVNDLVGEAGINSGIVSLSDGSFNNGLFLFLASSTGLAVLRVRSAGVDSAYLTTPITADGYNMIAFAYSQDSFALVGNGTEIAADGSGDLPVGINLTHIGGSPLGAIRSFNRPIRGVTCFSEQLPNEILQALTANP